MYSLNCKGKLLVINRPIVMGIINITPDSFYAGSRIMDEDAILKQAEKMLSEGASILDIGGQSTRPGSEQLTADEELLRVIPAIEKLVNAFPEAIISIDTFFAEVAKAAIHTGASIVNDISAGNMDDKMLETVAALQVPYIAMHMKGTPQTMQQQAHYENLTQEVIDYFMEKTEACRLAGINDIIIDPGFGFAKTISQNLYLLREMKLLQMLHKPILAGISRKSTIYKTLGITAEKALNGTTVLNTLALQNGANILRVHDVKEAVEAITLFEAYKSGKND